MTRAEGLRAIAKYADSIAPTIEQVVKCRDKEGRFVFTDLIDLAHKQKLKGCNPIPSSPKSWTDSSWYHTIPGQNNPGTTQIPGTGKSMVTSDSMAYISSLLDTRTKLQERLKALERLETKIDDGVSH